MKSPSLGKFKKIKNDKYYSIDPKIGHTLHMDLVDLEFTYIEPCVGGGDLVDQIQGGNCVQAIDIAPEVDKSHEIYSVVEKGDARIIKLKKADYIISNPAFSREYLPSFHEMMKRFLKEDVKAIYMLLPFNFSANESFQYLMEHCESVRPTGRLKWFDNGSGMSDTKDHAWYKFVKYKTDTIIKPRHSKKRKTNQQFIKEVRSVIIDEYEYPNIDVSDFTSFIQIKCLEHGIFEKRGITHLKGARCPSCIKNEQLHNWKEQCSEKHESLYDYTHISNIDKYNKNINLICPKHGEFKQTPDNHRYSTGCKKCSSLKRRDGNKLTIYKDEFLEKISDRSIKLIGKYFDYETDTVFECLKHGDFISTPSKITKRGCLSCNKENRCVELSDFYKEELKNCSNENKIISNLNDRLLIINLDTRLEIYCKKHGEYLQKVSSYLKNSQTCQKCKNEAIKKH